MNIRKIYSHVSVNVLSRLLNRDSIAQQSSDIINIIML